MTCCNETSLGSTIASLEAAKLSELGLERVSGLCAAVDLVLEVRHAAPNEPLMAHRHLSDMAGRELTKAPIEDIITRGTISTWRKLIDAVNSDAPGRIARRVSDLARALGKHNPKARAFGSPRSVRFARRGAVSGAGPLSKQLRSSGRFLYPFTHRRGPRVAAPVRVRAGHRRPRAEPMPQIRAPVS